MGKTQNTGRLTNGIFQDSSNNIAIGDSTASGFKFKVTGTSNLNGALSGTSATFSDNVTINKAAALSILTLKSSSSTTGLWLYLNGLNATLSNQDNGSLAFQTNGTDRLTIASTGAATFSSSVTTGGVSIGVAATANVLNVRGENSGFDGSISIGARSSIQHRDSGDTTLSITNDYNSNSAKMEFRMKGNTTSDAKMTILGSGNVGIGTSSPRVIGTGYKGLEMYHTSGVGIWLSSFSDTYNGYLSVDASGTSLVSITSMPLILGTNNTERMRIRPNGELVSLPTYNNTTSFGASVGMYSDGTFYRSTSSLKYKKDVQDAWYGLADVMKLRAVTYKSINERDGDLIFGGLIAEEVDAAELKEFVVYAEDGTPDSLQYGNMVSLLVKAIQEQQQMINELKALIAAK